VSESKVHLVAPLTAAALIAQQVGSNAIRDGLFLSRFPVTSLPYFIAAASTHMPPPLSDGQVKYDDGSPETVNQYATDVAAFLMWAAEPHLEVRKEYGFRVIIFLLIFGALVYMTKRKIWHETAPSH